jgi:hypothetical protein
MENKKTDNIIYLVLYETNPNKKNHETQKFEGEIMSTQNFEINKSEDFDTMKNWALQNGKKVFILKVEEPLIKIIPEVKVINNSI